MAKIITDIKEELLDLGVDIQTTMNKILKGEGGKWSKGEFFPEPDAPTHNPGADAYQRAILGEGRIIPGFAFGETSEECTANAWMLAASKEMCKALQMFINNDPDARKKAEQALYKAMGHLEK